MCSWREVGKGLQGTGKKHAQSPGWGCSGDSRVTAALRVADPSALTDPRPSVPGFLWGVEQLVPVGDILKVLSPRWKGFPQAAPAEPSLAQTILQRNRTLKKGSMDSLRKNGWSRTEKQDRRCSPSL